MKKLLLLILILSFNAYSDDDFGDEVEEQARRVVLRDSTFSKNVSLFTINVLYKIDKFIFRPISYAYSKSTTNNFRLSLRNTLQNISSGGNVINNILIFSNQRFISSFGSVIFNTSVGMLGTLDASKKFELEKAETSIVDILRFYNVPEVYFFMLGPIPLTFTTTLSLGLGNVKGKYYSVSGGFVLDFLLGYINERAIDKEKYDLLISLKAEIVYETLKNKTFADAKYFKIKRDLFPTKRQTLKGFLEERNR